MRLCDLTCVAVAALLAACTGTTGSSLLTDGVLAGDARPGDTMSGDLDLSTLDEGLVPDGCEPSCAGKECGSNGCGGSCGICSAGLTCDDGICVARDEPCEALEECYPRVCDADSGKCADCTEDEQCVQAGDVCDEQSGQCVACTGSEDCPENHECVDKVCIPPVTCESSKDCADDEVCDKVAGICVECVEDADCGEGFRCTSQECEVVLLCVSDKDCKEYDKVCDKAVGECVDCLTDDDCEAARYCELQVCLPDACDPALEWPGCVDNAVAECSDNGSVLTTLQECAEGTFCQGAACVDQVCEPGTIGCEGPIAYGCDGEGSGYLWTEDCSATSKACAGGECVDCDPQCGDKACGPDACGGSCGTCDGATECLAGSCLDATCPEQCTGKTGLAFLCALDICYPDFVFVAAVSAPLGDDVDVMFEALPHYGAAENDLGSAGSPSVAVLVTGNLNSQQHLDSLPPNQSMPDPFTGATAHDVVQAEVAMVAPPGVTGFSVDYVFMSMEYAVQQQKFNDKFYLVLTAAQTTAGEEKVINYVLCKNPLAYTAFEEDGQKYCYVGAIAELDETPPVTNIGGTGYQTSSGWMRTTWPINAGEEFSLLFHLQDTNDAKHDAAVVLDNFQWTLGTVVKGTVKL